MGGACFNGASVKRPTYKGRDVFVSRSRWDGMDGCLQSDGRYNEYVIGWRGQEVGGMLVGGRFSFSGLKGCSQVALILLLSLPTRGRTLVRSVWPLRQSYEHFQNFLSTNLTSDI
jgi:hypothetical protein